MERGKRKAKGEELGKWKKEGGKVKRKGKGGEGKRERRKTREDGEEDG